MKKTTTTKKNTPAKSAVKPATITRAPARKATPATIRKKSSGQVEAPATFISVRADIGFGNHLYIRGEGPGLSWTRGVAMDCIAADGWASTVKAATSPVIFKVLINDETWSKGNDYVVEPGQSVTVTPTF